MTGESGSSKRSRFCRMRREAMSVAACVLAGAAGALLMAKSTSDVDCSSIDLRVTSRRTIANGERIELRISRRRDGPRQAITQIESSCHCLRVLARPDLPAPLNGEGLHVTVEVEFVPAVRPGLYLFVEGSQWPMFAGIPERK